MGEEKAQHIIEIEDMVKKIIELGKLYVRTFFMVDNREQVTN